MYIAKSLTHMLVLTCPANKDHDDYDYGLVIFLGVYLHLRKDHEGRSLDSITRPYHDLV